MTTSATSVAASGTFLLGGDLTVHRLGYGTMQLPGPGVWGEPRDRGAAIAVLRRAAELGIDLFDTADSYGPFVAEDLLREALHPYEASRSPRRRLRTDGARIRAAALAAGRSS